MVNEHMALISAWNRSASALFTAEERATVEAAVREAEQRTAAEIVPVVTFASSRHHRGQDIAGVWSAFVVLIVLAILSPEHQIDGVEAVLGFVIALAGGSFAASRIPALKRLFLGRADLEEAVADGAVRAFRTFGVGETTGRTGLLIYVSLFERSAIVLGDAAMAQSLTASDYASIRDILIDGLGRGQIEQALVAAIRKAGDILAERLPRAADDKAEITDALRLLD
jgi:putative membrane protein